MSDQAAGKGPGAGKPAEGAENGGMDAAAWSQAMAHIAEQSQRLVADFLTRNQIGRASCRERV